MVDRFAAGRLIIVTTKTRPDHGKMINTSDGAPGPGGMTVVTGIGTLDMPRRFTTGLGAVMTGKTGSRCYTTVIKPG